MQGTGRKIKKRDENGYRLLDYAKGSFEITETADDLTAVVSDSIRSLQALKARGGRPAVYAPTKEGLQDFLEDCSEYFRRINAINQNPELQKLVIPDIEGLCAHLQISRQTLHNYSVARSDDWHDAIELVRTCIASAKKQLANTYRIPPVFAIFDMVNNHNYVNASEFKLTTEEPRAIEATKLENALEVEGLVWDEGRQEFVPADN